MTVTSKPNDVVDLEIGGMTCASCASRVERALNKVEGVSATVNYALERARVESPEPLDHSRLIEAVEQAGYEAHLPAPSAPTHEHGGGHEHDHDHELDAGPLPLATRVGLVALLAVPVIAMGMVPAWQFTNWQWLSLMLTFPIATWGAWPFHRSALKNLRHGAANMDTLVSAGVAVAFAWSLWALYFGDAGVPGLRHDFAFTADRAHAQGAVYFEVAAATTLFLLTGRWFESRARRRGADAIRALADLGAKDVSRLRADGTEERVPVDELAVGEQFVVRPGEKIATDGVVVDGSSAIDASLITGESVPIEVSVGDAVTGATVNAGGRLVIQARRVGTETTLARMAQLVADAQAGKAPVQRLADRVAGIFVPIVLLLAIATLGYWLGRGESFAGAATPAVALLIVACPCALGLATPTALLVGTGRGAQLGVLIRGPEVLETTRRVDTIVLDKTGTVTAGRMRLVDTTVDEGEDATGALRLLAGLEAASEHPIARAISEAVPAGDRPKVDAFRSTAGLGVAGLVDDVEVIAGRRSHVESMGLRLTPELAAAHAAAEEAGHTAVVAGWDGRARIVAAVADTVRPSSKGAIAQLRELGLEPVLLTGDNELVARRVADEVGIATVIAGVLPEGKVDEVRRLQDGGAVVAVVGDGVNDAAALAQADLGLAMGGGTDAAIAAADLTLVRDDLTAAVDAIRLSRRTLHTIKVNLLWAFGYNVAAIPVAASGLLNPMLAGLAMAASSVLVVTNSLRLFRFRSVGATVR
ncbi:MAG: heavy metal translocating P-type ATPase [Actinomycetota bacterium]|nr:heavy metal translocating P-type ATPase [Actinomycetota bacterium]